MSAQTQKQDLQLCALINYKMKLKGIRSLEQLAPLVGMKSATLYNRYKAPGKFTADELRSIYNYLKFEQDEKARVM